jgi:phage-related protein
MMGVDIFKRGHKFKANWEKVNSVLNSRKPSQRLYFYNIYDYFIKYLMFASIPDM